VIVFVKHSLYARKEGNGREGRLLAVRIITVMSKRPECWETKRETWRKEKDMRLENHIK
jgi:hypothetical protein